MSFQNSGITPSGRIFYRGENVLVEYVSHLLSGRISEISTGDFGEAVVNVTVDAGVLNTMGGKSATLVEILRQTGVPIMDNVPATIYLDRGFHHQSTTQTRVGGAKPSLFCFADEEPTFAMAGAPDAEAAPVIEEVTQEVEADTTPAQVQGPLDNFDPRDTDQDGQVSDAERKQAKKDRRK
jgi:hypothetical protein